MRLEASAPGSMMLLGEYAVLHGHHALVCAINHRLQVTLEPRVDNTIVIQSDRYGDYLTTLSEFAIVPPFQFILATLLQLKSHLPSGCKITITSSFPDHLGLGSSAALVVAALKVLTAWLHLPWDDADYLKAGRAIVQAVQGAGSGADIAASYFGGTVFYRADPLSFERIAVTPPLAAVYAGFKTKTADAIAFVTDRFKEMPALFRSLLSAIHECTLQGRAALSVADWHALGKAMRVQQGLMQALGVEAPVQRQLCDALALNLSVFGVKISGSGLGDCVLALGEAEASDIASIHGAEWVPVTVDLNGVHLHE